MLTILEDIESGKRGVFYARKGDKVKLIKESGHVLIVELKGNKFFINKSKAA